MTHGFPQTSFMEAALVEAENAAARGEVPVGAIVVQGNRIVTKAGNRVEETKDPLAHAEILAMRDAAQTLGITRLTDCDLYVTLEPCALCAAAISLYRLRVVYYGAYDPKGGAIDHGPRWFCQPTCLHRPESFGGIAESRCSAMLKAFFSTLRTSS